MNVIAPNPKGITVKWMTLVLIPQILPALEITNKHCSQGWDFYPFSHGIWFSLGFFFSPPLKRQLLRSFDHLKMSELIFWVVDFHLPACKENFKMEKLKGGKSKANSSLIKTSSFLIQSSDIKMPQSWFKCICNRGTEQDFLSITFPYFHYSRITILTVSSGNNTERPGREEHCMYVYPSACSYSCSSILAQDWEF